VAPQVDGRLPKAPGSHAGKLGTTGPRPYPQAFSHLSLQPLARRVVRSIRFGT